MNQFVEYANDELEESTISSWLQHDLEGASHALGEDLVSAVAEVLDYE
jgi:hypothetical protein